MRKHIVFLISLGLLLFALGSRPASAQYSYELGVGVKIGSPWASITAKYFLGDQSAVEGLGALGPFGLGLTGLYEYHLYFSSAPGWRWYFGGGGHLATGRSGYYNPYADGYYAKMLIGVDGVIGLEYKFEKYPFCLSLDVIPLLNLNDGLSGWWNAGLSVRYTFD